MTDLERLVETLNREGESTRDNVNGRRSLDEQAPVTTGSGRAPQGESANPMQVANPAAARPIEPFIVKHYIDDEHPSIKGNGFDGMPLGRDRQDAEEFVAWLNARLGASTPQNGDSK